MDEQKIAEIIDGALEEITAVLDAIILRVEDKHGPDIAINVAMNVGADIMAETLGRIKDKGHRRATLIGHVLNIANNMEVAMAGNTAHMLLNKIRKETKA